MKTLLSAALLLTLAPLVQAQTFTPPTTPRQPVTDTLFGVALTDPYRWLENKDAPEVKAWSKAQHAATLAFVEQAYPAVPGLRDEITAYLDRDVVSPLTLVGDKQFLTIKRKGEKQARLYTRRGGADVLLFDPEVLDPSGLTAISGITYTTDGGRVAVGVQKAGAEISTYRIYDTQTGELLAGPIEGLRGFSFMRDGEGAYITVGTAEMIKNQQPLQTFRHRFAEGRDADVFLIQPDDAGNFASVNDARDANVTFTTRGDFYATHALVMEKEGQPPIEIYSSQTATASPYALDDRLYIYTNDGAPNFKLMVATLDAPTSDRWATLIPEGDTVLDDYAVTNGSIVTLDREDLISRLRVYDLEGNFQRELALPEAGNASSVSFHKESNTLFVTLNTFTAPSKVYRTDASDPGTWTLFYEQEPGIDTSEIEGEVQFYTSKDGTRVPIILMYKRGLQRDGANPTILYGYGGFNIGMTPGFAGLNAAFINRGGVYAIAALRGGNEYGEAWHQAGMLGNKQNVFDDFIAAAEYLIAENYTRPENLGVYGGSNGGLLIGAMMTQRPDLFAAAICAVPLLDMVRYHRFLIARYWIPEYGDPDSEADFRTILRYSPYHNVRTGVNIPPTMITAGENDTRVDALHAKKMAARLQANEGQTDPILLYVDFESGHGTGKSTEQQVFDQEVRWRFFMNLLGMNAAAPSGGTR